MTIYFQETAQPFRKIFELQKLLFIDIWELFKPDINKTKNAGN